MSIDRSIVQEPRHALPTSERIRAVAIDLFSAQGFHGTSVRQLAAASGISIATLFHHCANKDELLGSVINTVMDDLIEQTEAAYAAAPTDPASQLAAVVRTHVVFHARRRQESFIGNSELRSLTPELREAVVAKRDRQQSFFQLPVDAGVADGAFRSRHPHEAARAIVTMCTAVATWFREDGPVTAEGLAETYVELALGVVRGYSLEGAA